MGVEKRIETLENQIFNLEVQIMALDLQREFNDLMGTPLIDYDQDELEQELAELDDEWMDDGLLYAPNKQKNKNKKKRMLNKRKRMKINMRMRMMMMMMQ